VFNTGNTPDEFKATLNELEVIKGESEDIIDEFDITFE
jgi:hypothetical protein